MAAVRAAHLPARPLSRFAARQPDQALVVGAAPGFCGRQVFQVRAIDQDVDVLQQRQVLDFFVAVAGPQPDVFVRVALLEAAAQVGDRGAVGGEQRIAAGETQSVVFGAEVEDAVADRFGEGPAGTPVPGATVVAVGAGVRATGDE